MLIRAATPLAVVMLLGLAGTAAGAEPRTCRELRGHDLAPAKSVKLVDRGGLLQSCTMPRGRIRLLASGGGSDTFTFEGHSVRQVAGAFALITDVFSDKYVSAEQTYFANLRTGRKRAIASTQNDVGVAPPPPDTRALKTFVTAGGRAVATILAPGATVRVVALGARGSLRTLAVANRAELPPESLTLVGATVSWVQSGEPVRARLP